MNEGYFSYSAKADFKTRPLGHKPGYDIYLVRYTSPVITPFAETNRVIARYYVPSHADRAVIVLHGINAELSARHLAAYLARRGIAAMQITLNYGWGRRPRVRPPAGEGRAAMVFCEGFKQAVLDTRHAADFLLMQFPRIGICGVSLGAIISSVVFSVDSRLGAAALILGGGEIAHIVFDSHDIVVRMTCKILRKEMTRGQLEEAWKEIEPLSYVKPDSRVLMVNARYDTVVRPPHTEKLWYAFGQPPIYWIKATHTSVYTHLFFIRSIVARHFKNVL